MLLKYSVLAVLRDFKSLQSSGCTLNSMNIQHKVSCKAAECNSTKPALVSEWTRIEETAH